MQRRYRTAFHVPIALMAVVAACGDDDAISDGSVDAPDIIVTTSIWADVTSNVACDGIAEIRTVIPVGGDPHSYEPSLQDRDALESADLIVANGLLLEESLEDTIDAAEQGGTPVFRFADHVTPIDSDDPEHVNGDPHVWFDPTRVVAALPALRDALVDQGGLDASRVDECVNEYRAAITETDTEMAALLDTVPPNRRKLVTNHDAVSYFAQHYGYEVLGAIIPAPSTLAEANPADLEALARLIEAADVPAIFAESQHSRADVDALAEAVGDVAVVTLYTDSLGPAGSGADTYLGLLSADARLIVDALS
jgi:zinc/manganese transport system substrate-binding protein